MNKKDFKVECMMAINEEARKNSLEVRALKTVKKLARYRRDGLPYRDLRRAFTIERMHMNDRFDIEAVYRMTPCEVLTVTLRARDGSFCQSWTIETNATHSVRRVSRNGTEIRTSSSYVKVFRKIDDEIFDAELRIADACESRKIVEQYAEGICMAESAIKKCRSGVSEELLKIGRRCLF